MGRLSADAWGGVFVTLVCLVLPVPVLSGHASGALPVGWWLAVYAAFTAAFLSTMWLAEVMPRRAGLAALAGQSVLGPVLVLTAPGMGWTPILLVLSVAVAAYQVPPRVSAGIVAANTAVVGAASALTGSAAFEVGMVAGLYLMLQAASVLTVRAHQRVIESRVRIAEANVRLRAATALQAEASRTEERLRIARELHDAVGHQLTVLALELEIASHRAGPESAEPIDRAKAVTRELLGEVRASVGEMRRTGPRLREVLETVVADLPAPTVHLRIDERVEADAEVTRALLRCVQEVVTNAIRHSRAANLWIAIDAEGDRIVFDARDDGLGARDFAPGNGLVGMAERVAALGGTAEFSGEDGFRVRAAVPA
ncbi:sensor histidine kinase [Glycomyces paridis]|uniref:Sensor histidine kinase n=1 Tax=Glycomyces paridis TaxID=2126555 RepID=A0A4S8P3P8_9ACTN|nr:sensor histidine kinase [Glycomyces paridis]THV23512.1 sensor histidine kinase [Glycomyces paridis]